MTGDQYSFMSGADSDNSNSPREEMNDGDLSKNNPPETSSVTVPNPLMTPPPLYSTDDYKIDGM